MNDDTGGFHVGLSAVTGDLTVAVGFADGNKVGVGTSSANEMTAEVVKAVLSVYPLDTFVDDSAGRMEVVGEPESILPVMSEVQSEVSAVGGPNPMISIERYAFYERAKKAYAVIQTGERRFYGCFAFRRGVIGPEEN